MNTLEYLEDNKIALLYGMTHLEGIGCTRAQTEDIIEYGKTNNVPPSDIQKLSILNMLLKEWQMNVAILLN